MKNVIIVLLILVIGSCSKNNEPANTRTVEIARVVEYTSLTITNFGNSDVNLSGWKLTEVISFFTTTTKNYNFQSVSIAKGASITFSASQLGFRLQKPDEVIYLYDQNGKIVDQMSWVSFE